MSGAVDPLGVTRLVTGAAASVAAALPEPLRTVVRVLDEAVGLAQALVDAGHDPVGKIAEMRRSVEDFAKARRAVYDEVDRMVAASMAPATEEGPAAATEAPEATPRPAAPEAPAVAPPRPDEGGA